MNTVTPCSSSITVVSSGSGIGRQKDKDPNTRMMIQNATNAVSSFLLFVFIHLRPMFFIHECLQSIPSVAITNMATLCSEFVYIQHSTPSFRLLWHQQTTCIRAWSLLYSSLLVFGYRCLATNADNYWTVNEV